LDEGIDRYLCIGGANTGACTTFAMKGSERWELQKRVAVVRPHMPIIFITGHGDVPTSVEAMKASAVEFLTKPFSDDELLNAVGNAIERSRVAISRGVEMRASVWYTAQLI